MDAVEATQLAIAYGLKTILAERTYELAEEEACSAREVKEAVAAETAEAGLIARRGTGPRLFLTSYCRGSTPASSTGRSGPSVSVSADRPRIGSAGVCLSYCGLHWNVEAALVQSMAVVVVAELDATWLAVTACRALVGQNLWFRPYHHHRKTETHRTTWLRPAT